MATPGGREYKLSSSHGSPNGRTVSLLPSRCYHRASGTTSLSIAPSAMSKSGASALVYMFLFHKQFEASCSEFTSEVHTLD